MTEYLYIRGGSWYYEAGRTETNARNWFKASLRNVSIGFRIVRSFA